MLMGGTTEYTVFATSSSGTADGSMQNFSYKIYWWEIIHSICTRQ